MKKYISVQTLTFTLTFLLGIAVINPGNAQSSADLIGSWNADFQKMNTSSNYLTDYNALPEQSKTRIREAFESRMFTFNSDQTVSISYSVGGNNRQVSGSWNYQASNNLLAIQVNGEMVEYQTTLLGNALTMEPRVQQPNAVFKSLSFTKN